jgi:hypothetical protein
VTVSELIDIALSQGDNVPESDAGYIDRRRRALNFLREVVHDIWWERDWPWKKTQADVTVLAGDNSVAVPWNFDSIGNYGGIYRLAGGLQQYPPIELVPEAMVMEHRSGSSTTSSPRIFALFGHDPATFVDLIQIQNAGADVDLRCFFQKQPPKLLDYGDPEQPSFTLAAGALTRVGQTATVVTATPHGFQTFDRIIIAGAVQPEYNGTFQVIVTGVLTFTYTVTGSPATPGTGTITVNPDVATANAALNEIPQRFHVKVVLNGVKAKLRESKGDARWQKLDADYQMGVANMKTELARFQGEIRQLPSFFGDRN